MLRRSNNGVDAMLSLIAMILSYRTGQTLDLTMFAAPGC